MEKLDLRKKIVLDLKKDANIEGLTAAVVLVLDKSGSMEDMYDNGDVQEICDRILPLGLGFDDNGEVDLVIFHNEAYKSDDGITKNNITTIVKQVKKQYSKYGGTQYAPAIHLILDEYIGQEKSSGLFGLGGKSRPKKKLFHPVYVIYVTDGANSDESATESALIEASEYPIFFQFVGIGRESFSFLKKLDDLDGRRIDNANFFNATHITTMDDTELYKALMKEFPSFVKECRNQNML